MQWADIRRRFPHQWVLVEAIEAHSQDGKRIVEDLSVIDSYQDGESALKGYTELHRR